jgi:hypothetical protein
MDDPLLQGQSKTQPESHSLLLREHETHERLLISEKVVKALASSLVKDEDCLVKEVIAAAIGGIGLPEAQICVESLIKVL